MGSRVLNFVLLFVVGLIVGTVGTVAQQSAVTVAGASIPWGVIVALVAVAALLAGLRLINRHRWQAVVAALGIMVMVAVFVLPSAGGSVLVVANAAGYTWIYGALGLGIVIAGWPGPRQRAASAAAGKPLENRIS